MPMLTLDHFKKDDSFKSDGETLALYVFDTTFFCMSIAEFAPDPPEVPGLTYLAQIDVMNMDKCLPVELSEAFESHFTIVDTKDEAVLQIQTFLTKLYGEIGRVLGQL